MSHPLLRIIYRVGRVPGGTPGLGHTMSKGPIPRDFFYKGDADPERPGEDLQAGGPPEITRVTARNNTTSVNI